MSRTQLRLQQVTGSFGIGSGQINDQIITTASATGSIDSSDLASVLSHLAASIKKIHGADSFTEAAAGEFSQSILPVSEDGAALGSASKEWSDLYLADDGVIYLGNDQDVTLTHVQDTGVLLNSSRQIQFGDSGTYINQPADARLLASSDGTVEIDAATTVKIDSDAGDISFEDGGVAQLAIDMDGTAGEIIMQLKVDSDDFVFKQYDGTEVFRVEDNGDFDIAGGAGSSGVTISSDGNINVDGISTLGATTGVVVSAAGAVAVNNASDSTSTTDGSLQTDGGLGVVKNVYIGEDLHLADSKALKVGAGEDVTLTHDGGTGATLASAGNFLIDGASSVSIDGAAGVNIGTNDSGVAISIGHATSEVTINDNLTVTGDLTVNGATTTIDTTNLLVEDPVIGMAVNAASQNQNGGLAIFSGSSDSDLVVGRVANDTWGFGKKATLKGTVTTLADMTLVNARASKFEIDGANDYIDVSTDLQIVAAADILLDPAGGDAKVDGNLLPNSADGGTLGSAAAEWSDLFLADSSVINFGNDQDTTLTHTDGSGIAINSTNKIGFGGDFNAYIQHDGTDLKIADDADVNIVPAVDFLVDAGGEIILDADGANIRFKDGGTEIGKLSNSSSDLVLSASVPGEGLKLEGNGDGVYIRDLASDMFKVIYNGITQANEIQFATGQSAILKSQGGTDIVLSAESSGNVVLGIDDSAGTGYLMVTGSGANATIAIGGLQGEFGSAGGALTVTGSAIEFKGGASAFESRYYDIGESHYVGFKAPDLTGNQIYTLPASVTDGYFLQTNGSGVLSWATAAGGTLKGVKIIGSQVAVDTSVDFSSVDVGSAISGMSTASSQGATLDVFVNGQILLSGSNAEITSNPPTRDFQIVDGTNLKFGFALEADDIVTVIKR